MDQDEGYLFHSSSFGVMNAAAEEDMVDCTLLGSCNLMNLPSDNTLSPCSCNVHYRGLFAVINLHTSNDVTNARTVTFAKINASLDVPQCQRLGTRKDSKIVE